MTGLSDLMRSIRLPMIPGPLWVRRALISFVILGMVTACAASGTWWYLQRNFNDIPTFSDNGQTFSSTKAKSAPRTEGSVPVDVADMEPIPTGTRTYLLLSTGSAGVDESESARLGIGEDRLSDADGLTDSLMLLVVSPDTKRAAALSIPRDTWIASEEAKINALYSSGGPQVLAQAITDLTGLPVDHMIAINFTAFADLTDAVGGVNVWAEGPTRDLNTGFYQETSGCSTFDGARALSYVRSRHIEYRDADGKWHPGKSASDFGRIKRQHQFLGAAFDKLNTPSSVKDIPKLIELAKDNIVIDDDLELNDVIGIAKRFTSGSETEYFTLPSDVGRVGKASVVFTNQEEAKPILEYLRTLETPPVAPTTTTTTAAVTTTVPGDTTTTTEAPKEKVDKTCS